MATKNKFAEFKAVDLKVYWIPVSKLKSAKFQPEGRDSRGKLRLLVKSIETNKFWTHEQIAIDSNFNIINGHRRVAAAKELGIEEVPCVVVSGNPQKIFSWMNDTPKPMSSRDVLSGYLRGNKTLTPKHKPHLELITDILGKDGATYIYSRGASHRVIHYAYELVRYLGRDETDRNNLAKTTRWLVEHKMQYIVRDHIYVRHTPPEVIAYYVDNNLPMIAGHPFVISSEQEQEVLDSAPVS
jgi:hypothetical protein